MAPRHSIGAELKIRGLSWDSVRLRKINQGLTWNSGTKVGDYIGTAGQISYISSDLVYLQDAMDFLAVVNKVPDIELEPYDRI